MSERPDIPLEQRRLELWTSNSWRRFHFQNGGPACEPITQNDGHPDLHFPGGFDGPVALRFIATWNACIGLPTDILENIGHVAIPARMNFQALREERDALIAVLQKIDRMAELGEPGICKVAKDALGKARK